MTELNLSRSIRGKVALITGAASGMGRATAKLFAAEGAKVAIADVQQDALEAVAKEIAANGGDARAWTCDLSNRDNLPGLVAGVVDHFGALDILVNNAGVSMGLPIDADNFEQAWDTTLAVNLTAQVFLIRAALPHLAQNGEGRIVNVASTEGLGATRGISPYTASKHGVIGLTKSLAVELARKGITVNCICPGPIHTGMTAMIPDEHKEKFAKRRVPKGRYADPEEVAHITLGVVLPAASYLNGAIIPVDGGLVVQNT